MKPRTPLVLFLLGTSGLAFGDNPRGQSLELGKGDAVMLVDLQNTFMEGGELPVPKSLELIPLANELMRIAHRFDRRVFASRDRHPSDHVSFQIWPPHGRDGTREIEFPTKLKLPQDTIVIDKGTEREKEAYSAFEGTKLDEILSRLGIQRLFVGGVATEYCVLNTVTDALKHVDVVLFEDLVRSIKEADGLKALTQMKRQGAQVTKLPVFVQANRKRVIRRR